MEAADIKEKPAGGGGFVRIPGILPLLKKNDF